MHYFGLVRCIVVIIKMIWTCAKNESQQWVTCRKTSNSNSSKNNWCSLSNVGPVIFPDHGITEGFMESEI